MRSGSVAAAVRTIGIHPDGANRARTSTPFLLLSLPGFVIEGVWLPDELAEHAAAETAWARRFLEALQPHGGSGVYVNFLDSDDDTSRIREAYGAEIYRRLAEVKAKYDPDNVFHHNKNIPPG